MPTDYDAIIIGGGIHGAACAAALSRRGYRILLLDQGDFASGVTGLSLRLIHGGVRDIDTHDPALVRETLRAREHLLRDRPHQVQPLPVLVPAYRTDATPWPGLGARLWLYDALSPRKVSPRHRRLSPHALPRLEPALDTHGLRSVLLYWDAIAPLPERLVLDYLAEARQAGADLRNYHPVDFVIVDRGVAQGVDFHDATTGARHRATAPLLLNAAGPWADSVLEATGLSLPAHLDRIKSTYLVLDLEGRGPRHAILGRRRLHGRDLLVLPWLGHHLIGSTASRTDDHPGAARPEDWEIDLLLHEAGRLLPGIGIDRAHALYAASGQRPVHVAAGARLDVAAARRAHLVDHAAEGVRGMRSLVGGRLGTAETVAGRVVRAAREAIGAPPRSGRPHPLPAPGPGHVSFLSPAAQEHLRRRYGQRAAEVAAYAAFDPTLAAPISPLHPDIGAQVLYAVEHEFARTVADVLLRRTAVGLTHDLGRAAAPRVAAILQARLGWSDAQRDQAVRDYTRELHRRFQVLDRGASPPAPGAAAPPAEQDSA